MQATSGDFRKHQEWRGFLGLFVALAALIMLAISTTLVGTMSENALRWVDHTRSVLTTAERLRAAGELADAKLLQQLTNELERETGDNPRQQSNINDKLRPALGHSGGVPFRSAIAAIESEEQRLLQERTAEYRRTSQMVWFIRSILVVTAVSSMVLGLLGVRRVIGYERRQIEALERESAERKKAEEAALVLSETKTQFVATVSHEIRTPLSGVIGMAELLMDQPELSDDSKDLAVRLHKASTQMLDVLNQILDFSKLEAGQMHLDVGEFETAHVIEDVVGLSKFKAFDKGLVLEAKIADDVPKTMISDEGKIRQILLNFVHNAIKFTAEGSVRVNVQLDGADRVKFCVKDTGIGLSQTSQQRLFKPYMQAEKSTQRKFGGTGLGLAISKTYVELLGGSLDLESETGKGTEIWFTVPRDLSTKA